MQEKMNIEIAHKLTESEAGDKTASRMDLTEIAEGILLAMVALATAWCGYGYRWQHGPHSQLPGPRR